jgi:hypothetical protein
MIIFHLIRRYITYALESALLNSLRINKTITQGGNITCQRLSDDVFKWKTEEHSVTFFPMGAANRQGHIFIRRCRLHRMMSNQRKAAKIILWQIRFKYIFNSFIVEHTEASLIASTSADKLYPLTLF